MHAGTCVMAVSFAAFMFGILRCHSANNGLDSVPSKFSRTGLILHSIPHSAPKIRFSSLDTNCLQVFSDSTLDSVGYDVWLGVDTTYAPNGIHLCGEISEKLRDTGSTQVEMACDSLAMLADLMQDFDYHGETWTTQMPYQKNQAAVVKCRDGRRVLVGSVGQYWGAYVRRQYFWGLLTD